MALPVQGIDALPATALSQARLVYTALLEHTGTYCSTRNLGQVLAGSESMVCRAVSRLRDLGLGIEAVRDRGYRLRPALEPLDAAAIRAGIGPAARPLLDRLEQHFLTVSTNELLLNRPLPSRGGVAVLADGQTGGRGRDGKGWYSPLGAGLYLSLGWRFHRALKPALLSMIPAVAVMRALHSLGVTEAGLKWPNDILLYDGGREPAGKLGGILVELRGPASRPWVVSGIGLNVRLPVTGRPQDLACTDLAAAGLRPASRNHLAAAILGHLLPMLAAPPAAAELAAAWNEHDCIRGHRVTLNGAGQLITGEARGVDSEGCLRIRTPRGMRRVRYGTLRLCNAAQ